MILSTTGNDSLNQIRAKINIKALDFNKSELLHLQIVFAEITEKSIGKARILDMSCSSCINSASQIVRNFTLFHEEREELTVKNTPTISTVKIDSWSDLTLKELRTQFPNIKATAKAKFIEQIDKL